ncbi:NAD+ synthase [Pseudomarimonas salicorniae]|uniref:Glutamine-dependent NAD(+) synthetase n=1 Tax=Pseudomarimonas salicorniae TaxID=2933270 RepID=A0ABT0GFL6_9GAMM|nr:NAD+ synthase [Lysobacter sp. CAU 1642]MCK7593321.1 NAD+ synthase [Lysobacter sp. CAU 1642]
MRLALAQTDFPVGQVGANASRIVELACQARDRYGAALILFPELALSGYPPEDLLLRPSFLAACEDALADVARRVEGIVVVLGHPESRGPAVYNALSVLRDGRIEATYRKRELPNYAVFDERRYFAKGSEPVVVDAGGLRIGLLVCEDLWFSRPLRETVEAGADLVLVSNASPYEADKPHERDEVLARRLSEHPVPLAYLNTVGGQDELVFDGCSVLADRDGHLHPAAVDFEEALLLADLDPVSGKWTRAAWPEAGDETRFALTWGALVRGTRDYLGKNGFRRALVGLSGGIDSALVLAIAVDALGPENVLAVRLPSRFTSDLSNDLAAVQADTMGVRLETLSIEPAFEGFLGALGPMFAGREADVTEENLQSRCRGAMLMALSNKFGHLLLTTGNKSEYAVGYATIYGDMCGGYAPLKDVYKTEVFELARWRNRDGEVIPQAVIDRPPSAELRENQKDEDSLPPYEVLDAILQRFIDREMSRAEIIAEGFDEATVMRVARLVFINEWKRRQSAPGPKVSRRAFGRERRYPITSGWS